MVDTLGAQGSGTVEDLINRVIGKRRGLTRGIGGPSLRFVRRAHDEHGHARRKGLNVGNEPRGVAEGLERECDELDVLILAPAFKSVRQG